MSWDWLYGPGGIIYRPPQWCSEDSVNAHPEYVRVCSQMAEDSANALIVFAVLLVLALIGLAQMLSLLPWPRMRAAATESDDGYDFYVPPMPAPSAAIVSPYPAVPAAAYRACSMQSQMPPMMTPMNDSSD
ncbi:hypothetical protein [Mycobacteroides abscessus]|uniref:hypothetical protein n=1 Tax=Mycobacteroides abscessus TaxID=36809 RepID=UPI0009A89A93|nr:hypothetical protein [Mycobacteroides abscessus]SKK33710.1 Uncharacterised protein [Mycobacteroides abscessus subsp. abscessus]